MCVFITRWLDPHSMSLVLFVLQFLLVFWPTICSSLFSVYVINSLSFSHSNFTCWSSPPVSRRISSQPEFRASSTPSSTTVPEVCHFIILFEMSYPKATAHVVRGRVCRPMSQKICWGRKFWQGRKIRQNTPPTLSLSTGSWLLLLPFVSFLIHLCLWIFLFNKY